MNMKKIGRGPAGRVCLRAVLILGTVCLGWSIASAATCPVVHHGPPTEADKALLSADYAKAESLYRAALAASPHDTELTADLVHALLRDQKVQEAADAVKAALATAPGSATLVELRGEVELRQGEPWIAVQTANEATKLDPCNGRTQLLIAHLLQLNSLYASARSHLVIAHELDPDDPQIRLWFSTLPPPRPVAEIENSQKQLTAAPTGCQLVSSTTATQIPFANIGWQAIGLDVKLNGLAFPLRIDTGAGGLLISSSVAKRVGLKPLSPAAVGGIGDDGKRQGYSALVDSIRIGDLEFRHCKIQVVDSSVFPGGEFGLIGTDVFSHFLVTLDFPGHKLQLTPLPPRPGEDASAARSLSTGNEEEDQAARDAAGGANTGSEKAGSSGVSPGGPYDRFIAPEMRDYTKVYRVGPDLILPGQLNGSTIKLFILDTGGFTTIISPQAASEVTRVHNDVPLGVSGLNGAVRQISQAEKITFQFANLSQQVDGVITMDLSKISRATGMEISGLLGASTLHLLTIHLDYRDGLVKFDYDPKRAYHF